MWISEMLRMSANNYGDKHLIAKSNIVHNNP